ncbi:MAG: putative hydrolase of the HAD superfamily [Acidimicrobiales bacterium]|jgi:HAD superfamily hydrolase (TIGR01549 family)|tara:strand:- start:189 stop:911 length:723 start_codon:yes stop_codon:yes gene_type:complete
MTKIRAVTFDLWNTLLTSSPGAVEIRSRFWSEVIDERGLEIDADLLHGTLSMLPDRFDEEWRAGRQYGPTEALADCFTAFGDRLTSEDRDALAAAFEAASYELKVAPVADAADVLSAVAATGVAVGIISDTALATGRHLRTYLDAYGILQHVTFAAFSDEVGVYKPDPAIFAAALDGLGIGDPATAAHVGDLKRTDVAGARAMGMSTVRFRGVVDDPEDGAEADHVIDRLADLPRVLGPG